MRLVAAFIIVFTSQVTAVQAEVMEGIAAIVNGEAITCTQIDIEAEGMAMNLERSGAAKKPPKQALWERALDGKIILILQKQEARKLELIVADEDIDRAMADVESSNNIPAGQLTKILETQGIDIQRYRETMHDRLLSSKLVNIAVRSKLQVSEESLREYFRKYLADPAPIREVKLLQIFISLPSDPTPSQVNAIYDKVEKLRSRVQAGEDFGQMASLHSDAPDASQGGEMGWFMPGSLPPRLVSVLELPVGKVSKIIRSPTGFHLLYASDERWHEPEIGESYDEVHARHILIKPPSTTDETTKNKILKRAENIAKDMQDVSDEEFASRAKEISQGPSAIKGGDLGWFKQGDMVPAFEQVAFKLEPGETSGVVESDFGLHVIRLVGKRHIDPNAFEAHSDRIKEILLSAEMQNQLPRWMTGLKARAVIERKECAL